MQIRLIYDFYVFSDSLNTFVFPYHCLDFLLIRYASSFFRFFITLQSMFACLYSVFKVPAADLSAVIISFGNDRVEMVRFEPMTLCL